MNFYLETTPEKITAVIIILLTIRGLSKLFLTDSLIRLTARAISTAFTSEDRGMDGSSKEKLKGFEPYKIEDGDFTWHFVSPIKTLLIHSSGRMIKIMKIGTTLKAMMNSKWIEEEGTEDIPALADEICAHYRELLLSKLTHLERSEKHQPIKTVHNHSIEFKALKPSKRINYEKDLNLEIK